MSDPRTAKRRLRRHLFAIALFLFPVLSLSDENPLRFIPLWVPQAQFAGYYVADAKGFYRARGVAVELLDGGPALPPPAAFRQGKADCGVLFLANGIVERSRGLGIVNVAQVAQRSAQLLVTRASSGIQSPKDMDGKKVGLWDSAFQVQAQALFRKFGVQVQVVPQTLGVNLFLRGGVDIASAMWHNEYHLLLSSGIDPNELKVFFYDEYGLNFPEDGIYCAEDYVRENREQVCQFTRASVEGWEYAFRNRDEALDILMKRAEHGNRGTNRAHQRWMLDRMYDIVRPSGGPSQGGLTSGDYVRVAAELITGKLIDNPPQFSEFYRPCNDE